MLDYNLVYIILDYCDDKQVGIIVDFPNFMDLSESKLDKYLVKRGEFSIACHSLTLLKKVSHRYHIRLMNVLLAGNLDCVKYILKETFINKNSLSFAVQGGNLDVVKYIYNIDPLYQFQNYNLLYHASLKDNIDIMEYLITNCNVPYLNTIQYKSIEMINLIKRLTGCYTDYTIPFILENYGLEKAKEYKNNGSMIYGSHNLLIAMKKKNYEMLDWVYDNHVRNPDQSIEDILDEHWGDSKMIEWFEKNYPEEMLKIVNRYKISGASVYMYDVNQVKYLKNKGVVFNNYEIGDDYINILDFLTSLNYNIKIETVHEAILTGDVNVLKHMEKLGFKFKYIDTQKLIDYASRFIISIDQNNYNFNGFKWLLDHNVEFNKNDFIFLASVYGANEDDINKLISNGYIKNINIKCALDIDHFLNNLFSVSIYKSVEELENIIISNMNELREHYHLQEITRRFIKHDNVLLLNVLHSYYLLELSQECYSHCISYESVFWLYDKKVESSTSNLLLKFALNSNNIMFVKWLDQRKFLESIYLEFFNSMIQYGKYDERVVIYISNKIQKIDLSIT